jgi:hypothetical protein
LPRPETYQPFVHWFSKYAFNTFAFQSIKETGGNQEQRRFILAIRRFNLQSVYHHPPFEWSKKPEAVRVTDAFYSPFDDCFHRVFFYPLPFERSRRPEAIKNKDVLSWPFDDSMPREVYLGRLTSSSPGRRPSEKDWSRRRAATPVERELGPHY